MVIGGSLAVIADDRGQAVRFSAIKGILLIEGIMVLLYSFMENSLAALPADVDTLSRLRPSTFNWPLYLIGLIVAWYMVLRATWPGAQNREGQYFQ